jgi:CheY-like chemotaxis protein
MRVLVVEDNEDFSALMTTILSGKGCMVSIVRDAEIGLLQAREIRPDLIFCDIYLPGRKSGLEFAQMLRADPVLSCTSMVAITGDMSDENQSKMHSAGFDMTLPKPVKFSDLTRALTTFAPKEQ